MSPPRARVGSCFSGPMWRAENQRRLASRDGRECYCDPDSIYPIEGHEFPLGSCKVHPQRFLSQSFMNFLSISNRSSAASQSSVE